MAEQRPYTLRCFNTPLEGGDALIEDFTARAERVSRRVRRNGGFWSLQWEIPLREGVSADYLREWLTQRLMCRIRQRAGGSIIWEGVIWEMALTLDGVKRRVSMDNLYNMVQVKYIDHSNEEQDGTVYTDDHSIATYGRRELIKTIAGVTTDEANNWAERFFNESLWPWPRQVRIDPDMGDGLSVYAVGDIYTASNKFVAGSHVDDTDTNTSTFIQEIIENDCEFLSVGSIEENTRQVTKTLTTDIRALDALMGLVESGDASANTYELRVLPGGVVTYGQADNEPQYYWYGRVGSSAKKRGLVSKGGEASDYVYWGIEPAVVRDYTLPQSDAPPNANLQDSRDSWVEETEMADGFDMPILISDDDGDEEMLRAQQRYRVRPQTTAADISDLLAEADVILGLPFGGL